MNKVIFDKKSVTTLIDSFNRTTEEIFSLGELRKQLSSGRKLCMKYGVDVTAADIHIGHAVNLWMYRKLQELGHKVVFLIGDFTTQIGDPTGKNKTRPIISPEEIQENSHSFIKQALMVLHNDPDVLEIRKNSEWYDKMSAKKLLSLISMVTHSKLIARDMFRKRIEAEEDIYEHELLYPILQAYDSVMLKTDLTIIGTDQLYNEMLGRFFQEKFEQPPQVIITTKITPGIDGKEKQSKSLGNYIGLSHSEREKFGRIMSIPDKLILDYFKVYTQIPLAEIEIISIELQKDPMRYKKLLAEEIVKYYHGKTAAEKEAAWFTKTFSNREIPQDAPVISIGKEIETAFQIVRKCFPVNEKSNSDIRRLFKQRAIEFNGKTVEDTTANITLKKEPAELKVGKKNWFKIMI